MRDRKRAGCVDVAWGVEREDTGAGAGPGTRAVLVATRLGTRAVRAKGHPYLPEPMVAATGV